MNKTVYKIKIAPNTWMNYDTFEISGNQTGLECSITPGRSVFDNKLRTVIVPAYYLESSEGIIGPFRNYEDALSELEYRNDPLGLHYVPNKSYKILSNPSLPGWKWKQIKYE